VKTVHALEEMAELRSEELLSLKTYWNKEEAARETFANRLPLSMFQTAIDL